MGEDRGSDCATDVLLVEQVMMVVSTTIIRKEHPPSRRRIVIEFPVPQGECPAGRRFDNPHADRTLFVSTVRERGTGRGASPTNHRNHRLTPQPTCSIEMPLHQRRAAMDGPRMVTHRREPRRRSACDPCASCASPTDGPPFKNAFLDPVTSTRPGDF